MEREYGEIRLYVRFSESVEVKWIIVEDNDLVQTLKFLIYQLYGVNRKKSIWLKLAECDFYYADRGSKAWKRFPDSGHACDFLNDKSNIKMVKRDSDV